MKKKPRWQQIAVLGAGPTSNFLFAIVFGFVLTLAAMPFLLHTSQVDGVSFDGVVNESGLKEFGIESGEIVAVNGESVNEMNFVVANTFTGDVVFLEKFLNLSVNETIALTIVSEGVSEEYVVETFDSGNGRGMIGINGVQTSMSSKSEWAWLGDFPAFFQRTIFWVYLLNIGIGIMNLLPLWITDGGQITRVILEKYFSANVARRIFNFVSFLALALIIVSIWPQILFAFL